MSQEKKDIVEEMGFGALANVLEMNVSNTLLKELLDRFDEEKGYLKTLQGKIYITPWKVAVALGITNGGNRFPDKYFLLPTTVSVASPIHKPPIFHVDNIWEWDWAKHVLNFLIKGVENKRKGKKQSVDGCIYVLMLIYFHETKFPHSFTPKSPPAPWVAHWTREMMLQWISFEATEPLGLLYNKGKKKEKTKTRNLDKKENGKEIKKKIVEIDSSSEEERFSESEIQENEIEKTPVIKRKQPKRVAKTQAQSDKENEQAKDNATERRKRALEMIREKISKKKEMMELSQQTLLQIILTLHRHKMNSFKLPTVNLNSEQLLQTQGSYTPSINAASNTRKTTPESTI
ncbi:hypothetical protein Ahy_B08g092580 [Arachis hypogaea]|uniref:Aminotransferase-like plant mobile domain-containing protein n=1 Tax=Arachis hypogaea TaxID=3818 RepID=A0A444Y462_ARAHY|nr:hypothetical protein Ahy_B08g092580 [Arachis hypogaea]